MIDPRWITGLHCTTQIRPAGRLASGDMPESKHIGAIPGATDDLSAEQKPDLGGRALRPLISPP